MQPVGLGLSEAEPIDSRRDALLLRGHQPRRRTGGRRYVRGKWFSVTVSVAISVYDIRVGKPPSCIRVGCNRRRGGGTTLETERRRDAFAVEGGLFRQVFVLVARTLE